MVIIAAAALAFGSQVKQVAGGYFVGILTTDGSVYGVGDDTSGMQPSADWKHTKIAAPTKMSLPGLVTQIAGAQDNLYALMKDGTVVAWGLNDAGQLGDGKPITGYVRRAKAEPVIGLTDIVQINASAKHAFAVNKSGQVYTWGDGSNTPKLVEGLPEIVKVDTANSHTLALAKDGSVYAWGSNGYGELGQGKVSEAYKTPVKVSNLPKAIDISAGIDESGAVTSDGRVFVWGLNTSFLLGDGKQPNSAGAPNGVVPTPTAMKGLSSVKSLSIDYGAKIALHSNGTLTAWGFDGYGEQGLGRAGSYTPTPKKPSISGVAKVTVIGTRAYVIKTDGSFWYAGVGSGAGTGPMKSKVTVFTRVPVGP